jgi:hypothetical protein
MFGQVKTFADETLRLIASEFPNAPQDPLLRPSIEFLNSVMAAKDSDDLVQLYQSGDHDEEFIVKSLVDRSHKTV